MRKPRTFSDLGAHVTKYLNTKSEKRLFTKQGKVATVHKYGKMVAQNSLVRRIVT